MRDDFIFGLLEDIRLGILKELHEVPESKRRIVPNGFNNHLHWQAGHILTVTDAIMFYFGSGKSRVDESYAVFFATGTRPSGWSGQPPAWEDILAQLHDQISQIRQTFKGKLHEPAAVSDNFLNAVTVDELFQIFLSHESIHTGMVTAMIKALQDLQG